eukprot:4358107-Prymnesium_polylepis.1
MSYYSRQETRTPLLRLHHVLAVGMRVGEADIAVATRSSRATPPRAESDFATVAEAEVGRTPLVLSRSAERALRVAM